MNSNRQKRQVRQEYINNLRLEASNIQRSTNAVRMQEETGMNIALPTDMRSLEEKRADTERLKIELRQRLSVIMDGRNANLAAQEIGRNDNLLYEVMQAIDVLIDIFSKRYSLGAPYDVFVRFAIAFVGVKYGVKEDLKDVKMPSNTTRSSRRQWYPCFYF